MLANVQVTGKNNFTPVGVWNYAGLQTGIHLKFVRSIAVCSQQDPQSPLSTWNRSLHLFQYTSHIHVSYFPQINKLINSIYTVNQLFPNRLFKSIFFSIPGAYNTILKMVVTQCASNRNHETNFYQNSGHFECEVYIVTKLENLFRSCNSLSCSCSLNFTAL